MSLLNKFPPFTHNAHTTTLSQFSAALVHELNQPLTAILCNTQACQRFIAQKPPNCTELRDILGDIESDVLRAKEVITRLKALFSNSEIVRQPLDINALIEKVVAILSSDMLTLQVNLKLQLASHLPQTIADPAQIQLVLLNLAINSLEAMAATTGLRQLQIYTERHDVNTVKVTVQDTGSGIAPELLQQIFQPFVTSKPKGLGMGLAISRMIITTHAGQLWALNSNEGGATLHFTLPIIQ